ncbi:PREDICTED: coiled-coil domain-containing protein 13-like [Amphimedon queenslandica]|uniref:Coiled-coil domain-containing protein 13 n=1 Tax=Amphimedon queenslandica TaxID=400682 RepID=A0A1X7U9X4_AMPQE|nr:PREDICTED: coiled-coil domain-containing protein 13-like [Amphimedon queenslandica]|eukprot:XP_019855489.1 PREDICTED: coiled-coil domain-containing protein 13-like [Amphimedon queenslandica]
MAVEVKGPITGLRELQDLQTSRLRERLAKKAVSNNSPTLLTINVDDNLDLQTHGGKNKDTITPHAEDESLEMEYLQKEVEKLQLKMSKSNSEIKEREREIEKLRKTIKEERAAMAEAGLSGSVTQKIVEISRKNRELHAELARERNRTQKGQEQISELKELLKSQELHIEEIKRGTDSSVEQRQKEMISQLEEQLSHAKQKLTEYNNHIQLLKHDIKVAQKVLVKEVGEGATIGSLTANGDGWRGRAQQILSLQNKVSELQGQLEAQGKVSRASSRKAQELDKQRVAVRKIETENKQKIQELKSELESHQSDMTELRQQNKALKARNNILSSEVKEYRTQINLLSQELREKEKAVAIQQDEEIHCAAQQQKETKKMSEYEDKLRSLQSQLSHSRGERQRLQATVSELQNKLSDTTLTHQTSSSSNVCTRTQNKGIEKDSVKLPPIKEAAGRQQKESKPLLKNTMSAGNNHEPQGKYSSEEFEQVVAVCRVTEVERDRLLGLSQMLQQRLDGAYTELASLRQQLMLAERLSKGKTKSNEEVKPITELQEQILLREDENEVLKETLKLTQQEKLKDMKLLQNLLHETRQTFNNVLKKSI